MPTQGAVIGGRYALTAPLGSGGACDVWRAVDRRSGGIVALKILRDTDQDGRIRREARLLSQLDHRNIVHLLDAGATPDGTWLALEYVDGEPLSSRLGRGPLPPSHAAAVGRELASALAVAHAEGVVHRDVKPSNVLLDGDGHAHLADFGIARVHDGTRFTQTAMAIGTPAYLAPEQLRGDTVGPEADVYALGLVLLECLTGAPAFDGAPHEAAAARLVRDPAIPRELPHPWVSLLGAMTATEPRRRPRARDVARRLDPTTDTIPFSVTMASGEPTALLDAVQARTMPFRSTPRTRPVQVAGVKSAPVTATPATAAPVTAARAARPSSHSGRSTKRFALWAMLVAVALAGGAAFATAGSGGGAGDHRPPSTVGRAPVASTPTTTATTTEPALPPAAKKPDKAGDGPKAPDGGKHGGKDAGRR